MVKHWVVTMMGVFAAACGSSDGSGDKSSSGSDLLSQSPHCTDDNPSFHVQGTLDGVAIDDARSTNSNAGLVNIGKPTFDTPFSTLATLSANQMELHITWQNSLLYGQTGPTTGATLVAPASHPRAGQSFCITAGSVGFVDGGAEDGGFKFHITGVRSGTDCSVDVPVDLRGCYN